MLGVSHGEELAVDLGGEPGGSLGDTFLQFSHCQHDFKSRTSESACIKEDVTPYLSLLPNSSALTAPG